MYPVDLNFTADNVKATEQDGATHKFGNVAGLAQVTVSMAEIGDTYDEDRQVPKFVCKYCGGAMVSQETTVLQNGDDWCPDNPDANEPHIAQHNPLTWVKSAQIELRPDDDRIDVSISVGDPRGGFVMQIARSQEDGSLIMFLPHEGMNEPHMKLTKMYEGAYRIG